MKNLICSKKNKSGFFVFYLYLSVYYMPKVFMNVIFFCYMV